MSESYSDTRSRNIADARRWYMAAILHLNEAIKQLESNGDYRTQKLMALAHITNASANAATATRLMGEVNLTEIPGDEAGQSPVQKRRKASMSCAK
jgi:hypothetical protein